MSETRTDGPRSSDFTRALNSMMDNVENVVVKFQQMLLITLERIEKLESLEKTYINSAAPVRKELHIEETRQSESDSTVPSEMFHEEPTAIHDETEATADAETKLQQPEEEISEPVFAESAKKVREGVFSKMSSLKGIFGNIFAQLYSKSSYLILAIALIILGIAMVKLYFMLFP